MVPCGQVGTVICSMIAVPGASPKKEMGAGVGKGV